MFKWLESELKKAEENDEFVFILNHFPLNGDFTLTECAKRFQALFDRYEYIIRGIFSGHTHLDDIEGIGSSRKKALIKKFGSITKMLNADITELEEILPTKVAIELKNYLEEKENSKKNNDML